jgi:hypothetical protein
MASQPDSPRIDRPVAIGYAIPGRYHPGTVTAGWALNCEDAMILADSGLRHELKTKHPAVWQRVEKRRRFVSDKLGVEIPDSTLLVSSTPLCLPPFWLAPGMLLARA